MNGLKGNEGWFSSGFPPLLPELLPLFPEPLLPLLPLFPHLLPPPLLPDAEEAPPLLVLLGDAALLLLPALLL